MNCGLCGVESKRLAKHIQESHPDEYLRQQEACVAYYLSGLTFEEISARPDVIYKNRMSVSRVVKRAVTPDFIREHRKSSNTVNYDIDNTSVYNTLRRLIRSYNSHLPILDEFSQYAGLNLDRDAGVISGSEIEILVIPNSIIYADERSLAGEFIRQDDNIKRVVFFLDELIDNPHLLLSMISARINTLGSRIYARKCSVEQVDGSVARKFFSENHISGHVKSEAYIGLTYLDTMVAMISIRKPYTSKYDNHIEIARFATKVGTSVVGGFSRLLKATKSLYQGKVGHILSYCDLRYGSGGVYDKSGFIEIGRTKPDYCYTDGVHRYHRFKYRADSGTSEREIAASAGVFRMYGAGSKIYEMPV